MIDLTLTAHVCCVACETVDEYSDAPDANPVETFTKNAEATFTRRGWRCCGTRVYCPRCTHATWEAKGAKRNDNRNSA